MTELQRAKWTHNFNVLDHNGDGLLEKKDIREVADNLAEMRGYEEGTSSYEEVQEQMMQMWHQARALSGAEEKSHLTLEDWIAHEEELINSDELIEDYMKGIAEAVFNLLDADGDGKISEEEYVNAVQAYGGDREQGQVAFEKLDVDESGSLTWEELLKAVKQFHLSDDPEARGNWLFGPYPEPAASA